MQQLKISIPEPCHEDWNKMTNTEKGKFCGVCSKEVIDFTYFSDEQLVKHFNRKQNLCGRINTQQLNRDLILDRKNRHNFTSYLIVGLFSLFLFNSHLTKAQEKPKTEQTDKKYTSIPLSNTLAKDIITVSGIVVDENNSPLPGATIIIKGSKAGTTTDFDGKFTLKCKKNNIICVSYISYLTKEITALNNSSNTNINLLPNKNLLNGEVVITALGGITSVKTEITGGITYIKKRWIGGNLFTRFTNIFSKHKRSPKFRYVEE